MSDYQCTKCGVVIDGQTTWGQSGPCGTSGPHNHQFQRYVPPAATVAGVPGVAGHAGVPGPVGVPGPPGPGPTTLLECVYCSGQIFLSQMPTLSNQICNGRKGAMPHYFQPMLARTAMPAPAQPVAQKARQPKIGTLTYDEAALAFLGRDFVSISASYEPGEPAKPLSEMCCGGVALRATCPYHGPSSGA